MKNKTDMGVGWSTSEALGELLAVIHGDGGHYQSEHGTAKATKDAIAKWYARSHDQPWIAEKDRIKYAERGEVRSYFLFPEGQQTLIEAIVREHNASAKH